MDENTTIKTSQKFVKHRKFPRKPALQNT